MQLDIKSILERLPHRYPMLLIDRVLEMVPGKSIKALKNVSINEPFFVGHFPHHPVMPGVLILEAMAQAAAIFYGNGVLNNGVHMVDLALMQQGEIEKACITLSVSMARAFVNRSYLAINYISKSSPSAWVAKSASTKAVPLSMDKSLQRRS